MDISLGDGAITTAILLHLVGYGYILNELKATLKKTGEQLDRLIISTERAQSREEAKAQFALEALNKKMDG